MTSANQWTIGAVTVAPLGAIAWLDALVQQGQRGSSTPAHGLEPTQTPKATLGTRSTHVSRIDRMTMVYVPAGDFPIGSRTGQPDERPPRAVYPDAFWLDQTKVTNRT